MSPGVPEQTHRALRVSIEDAFGDRLRAFVARADAKPADVARLLGLRREDLYETFDAIKHFRAAWLELLPPAVERLYLEERAAVHGLELREVADRSSPRDLGVIARELGDVLTAAAIAESDGHISVEEAERELAEWGDVDRVMSARRAQLRRAVEQRGLSLVTGGAR